MKICLFFCLALISMLPLSAKSKNVVKLESKHEQMQNEIDYLYYERETPPTNHCLDNGLGISFIVSPLYWRASEDGLEYAIVGAYSTAPININNLSGAESKQPDFEWDWGVKVGFDFILPVDKWDVFSAWTHFRTSTTDHVFVSGNPDPSITANTVATGNYVSPFWVAKIFGGPGYLNDANVKWEMRLDMIDLLLGREYMVSDVLFLKPFIGLRNGWIYQKYNLSFFGFAFPTFDQINRFIDVRMRNNFWGIGPKLGMNSEWLLGKGFSLFGNIALSILDGFFHLTYKLDDTQPNTEVIPVIVTPDPGGIITVNTEVSHQGTYSNKNRIHRDVGIAELAIGLKWMKEIATKACISIWAGFEQNIFFAQNQFMNHQYDFTLVPIPSGSMESGGPNYFTDRGNLSTSGFSGGANLSF